MTDEELTQHARDAYEKEAKNWPHPIGWDNLGKPTQQMWKDNWKRKHMGGQR